MTVSKKVKRAVRWWGYTLVWSVLINFAWVGLARADTGGLRSWRMYAVWVITVMACDIYRLRNER